MLGMSCQSGVIAFWDCNTNKNLFSLSPHLSPATGIAFSPINDTLALSVGLDKKLVCCDTKTKKQIINIQAEAPLTSADFDNDGASIAVGTSRGRLLIYDLRSPKTPVHNIAGHNSSVTSVVYKPKPATASHNPSTSGVSSATKTRSSRLSHQKSAPSLKTVKEEGKENSDPALTEEKEEETFTKADEKMFSSVRDESIFPSSNRRESLSSMLFSPLRDSDSSFSSNIGGGSVSRDQDTGRLSQLRRVSSDSVFSPLRDSPGPGSANVSSKRTPFTSFSTPPTMSPLTIIREEARPESIIGEEARPESGSSQDMESGESVKEKLILESPRGSFVKETINTTSKSPLFQTAALTQTDLSHQQTDVSHKIPGQEKSLVEKPEASEFMNVITAFPHLIEGRDAFNGPPQPDIR